MYDVTFLGNAPVDVLLPVKDDVLERHNLKKGDWMKVAAETLEAILKDVPEEKRTIMPGGSVANSAYTFANLGGSAALCAYVGDDSEGRIFHNAMVENNITMPAPVAQKRTLIIYILITPDGERTFISEQKDTNLAPRALISEEGVKEDYIRNSQWLFIEGYLFESDFTGILKACRLARKHQTKIALTLAAPFFVTTHFDKIALLVRDGISLYICNDEELLALKNAELAGDDQAHAQQTLVELRQTPHLVTYGAKGATYFTPQGKTNVPTTPAEKVVDATGAGDAFAAGFLYEMIQGTSAEKAIEQGHNVAGKVIQQVGARLAKASF